MNQFEFLKNRFQLRSASLTLLRSYQLFLRYGLYAEKFSSHLINYVTLLNAFGMKPTFPVTASIVDRHPTLFKKLQSETEVEFAIHGYRHVDCTALTSEQFISHLTHASDIFYRHGLHFSGFRFPFLRKDDEKSQLLHLAGIRWDSSDSVFWHLPQFENLKKQRMDAYDRIIRSYQGISSEKTVVLPQIKYSLIEMPISMPDDDMLADRLGLSWNQIETILAEMIKRTRDRGEMMIYQLHPERFPWFCHPLTRILDFIKNDRHIWRTSLDEIETWWRERSQFRCTVEKTKEGTYHVSAHCSERASVMIKRDSENKPSDPFWKSWNRIRSRHWEMRSIKKPVIGIHPKSAAAWAPFLQREGFVFEISDQSDEYNLFLEQNNHHLRDNSNSNLLQTIENSPFPLVRFWRWPEQKQYCFAITGDIDAIDIWDYLTRYHG